MEDRLGFFVYLKIREKKFEIVTEVNVKGAANSMIHETLDAHPVSLHKLNYVHSFDN